MKTNRSLFLLLLMQFGCAPANVSPGMTFLVGLNHYQAAMETLEARPERWVDRQRLAESLKTTHLVTMGGSRQFNRLVDLDLRKREFLITLRSTSLRPDRAQEMKQELVQINKDTEDLKGIIKAQIANAELQAQEQPQRIETIATIGLLNLALDAFSSPGASTYTSAPTISVGQYIVTDQGNLTAVRTPQGQTYRCATTLVPEEGASIKCEPPAVKP